MAELTSTLQLPTRRPATLAAPLHDAAARPTRAAAAPTQRQVQPHRLLRPRMWWPIRSPTAIRGSMRAIDWDATIAFRRHLWSLGLGVAEAMDTAQRGMGLDWPNSLELIRRSLDAAQGLSRRADRLGRRHRPPRARRGRHHRRRDPRLRGADAPRSKSSAAASS